MYRRLKPKKKKTLENAQYNLEQHKHPFVKWQTHLQLICSSSALTHFSQAVRITNNEETPESFSDQKRIEVFTIASFKKAQKRILKASFSSLLIWERSKPGTVTFPSTEQAQSIYLYCNRS